jgi:hypothetical protein
LEKEYAMTIFEVVGRNLTRRTSFQNAVIVWKKNVRKTINVAMPQWRQLQQAIRPKYVRFAVRNKKQLNLFVTMNDWQKRVKRAVIEIVYKT